MATFGEHGATLGLIFAWLIMFGCISFGIYLIVKGIEGKSIITPPPDGGTCKDKNQNNNNKKCMMKNYKNSCNNTPNCTWSSWGDLSGGAKVGYIIGGLFTILLGIGLVMIANWTRNKARTDRNFAAVIGTGALAEGIAHAFSGR